VHIVLVSVVKCYRPWASCVSAARRANVVGDVLLLCKYVSWVRSYVYCFFFGRFHCLLRRTTVHIHVQVHVCLSCMLCMHYDVV
jgi:hypothetical protein